MTIKKQNSRSLKKRGTRKRKYHQKGASLGNEGLIAQKIRKFYEEDFLTPLKSINSFTANLNKKPFYSKFLRRKQTNIYPENLVEKLNNLGLYDFFSKSPTPFIHNKATNTIIDLPDKPIIKLRKTIQQIRLGIYNGDNLEKLKQDIEKIDDDVCGTFARINYYYKNILAGKNTSNEQAEIIPINDNHDVLQYQQSYNLKDALLSLINSDISVSGSSNISVST